MSKIYAVMSNTGTYEDVYVTVEKCFTDIKKAESFVAELEEDDRQAQDMARRCGNCDGNDRTCPFWLEPTELSDGCDSFNNWFGYEPIHYFIKDTELE